MKIVFSRQFLETNSNIKINGNPSVEAELFHAERKTVEPGGQTDGQILYITMMRVFMTMVVFEEQ